MKKSKLSLLAALLLAAQFLPAQTLLIPMLRDSNTFHYFDATSGAEQFGFSSKYHYNADNLEDSALNVNIFGGSYTYYKAISSYDPTGLLVATTSYQSTDSDTGPWTNWLKDVYDYDAQGRNTFFEGQFGNASGGWDNYYRQNAWFDDAAPADSSLYELWDATAVAWGNYRRQAHYYFPDGKVKQNLEDEWNMTTNVWRPLNREKYAYYPDGKILTLKTKSWDVNELLLVKDDSLLYRADGKLDSTFVTNHLGVNGADNRLVVTSHYDAEGNLIEENTFRFLGGSTWAPTGRKVYAPADGYYSNDPGYEKQLVYNEGTQAFEPYWDITRKFFNQGNGNVLYTEIHTQRNSAGALVLQSIDSTWYSTVTVGVNGPLAPVNADCKFANPFRTGSYIVCNAPDNTTAMYLRIVSATGQMVSQARVMPGESWAPASNMPAGLYFLSAWQNGKYLGQKKMVVGN